MRVEFWDNTHPGSTIKDPCSGKKKEDGKDLEIKKKKQPVIKYRDNYACGATVPYVNSPGRLIGIGDARGRGWWGGRGGGVWWGHLHQELRLDATAAVRSAAAAAVMTADNLGD